MRRVFPVVVLSFVVAVGLIAMVLQPSSLPALAASAADEPAADIPLTSSIESRPVLLSAAYRSEDVPAPVAAPSADATPTSPAAETVAPAPAPSASPIPTPKKPKKPKAATKTRKARNVPDRPLDKHTGKRIVYDKKLMTVWLMNKKDEVVGKYPVVGRWDRPAKGTYRVFSKSPMAWNPNSQVTFANMVRFTYGPDTKSPIGFHAIPRYSDGSRMHPVSALGLPIATGGCIRMSDKAAKEVYDFMKVGDLVVVLPSP